VAALAIAVLGALLLASVAAILLGASRLRRLEDRLEAHEGAAQGRHEDVLRVADLEHRPGLQ